MSTAKLHVSQFDLLAVRVLRRQVSPSVAGRVQVDCILPIHTAGRVYSIVL